MQELDGEKLEKDARTSHTSTDGSVVQSGYLASEYTQQYVSKVNNYSSEYGDVDSHSYVASNLIGRPQMQGYIGDLPSAFSLRTYGNTWHQNEEYCPTVSGPTEQYSRAIDFIDISFEIAVSPVDFMFFENINPGSALRIWGLKPPHTWLLLWNRNAMKSTYESGATHAITKDHHCNMRDFRIEFDQSNIKYYYGCLGIKMRGYTVDYNFNIIKRLNFWDLNFFKFSEIVLEASYIAAGNFERCSPYAPLSLLPKETDPLVEVLHANHSSKRIQNGYFNTLPVEVLFRILSYLDLKSLSKVSQSCKLLNSVCADPFLFKRLNIRNCWMGVKPSLMEWLGKRATRLSELDFSWCGNMGMMKMHHFIPFLTDQLTVLHLQSCTFLTDKGLRTIHEKCPNLTVLDISGCTSITHMGFEGIVFNQMIRLNVSKTTIGEVHLLHMAKFCQDTLKYLHIVNCSRVCLRTLLVGLASMNVNLVCLEAWKTRLLTLDAFHCIAKFTDLEILDIGWCMGIGVGMEISEAIAAIIHACKKLKIFILTSARSINDHALSVISLGGKNLEWLDISGNRYITQPAVAKLLDRRQEHLKVLDVSHCPGVTVNHAKEWTFLFPSVRVIVDLGFCAHE